MAHPLLATDAESARPLWLATQETWPQIAESLPAPARAFASAQGFEAKPGTHCLLPDAEGGLFGAAVMTMAALSLDEVLLGSRVARLVAPALASVRLARLERT